MQLLKQPYNCLVYNQNESDFLTSDLTLSAVLFPPKMCAAFSQD